MTGLALVGHEPACPPRNDYGWFHAFAGMTALSCIMPYVMVSAVLIIKSTLQTGE